jgi:DNA-binding response OmpR family regulator
MIEASNHVLIVEDDPDVAESIRYWLEREGMSVSVAATGEQGLDAALDAENPPALVLLDLMLPGMSGLELCRRLRREPATRRTPIIMVTARSSESEIVTGLDAGADDYVTKPFSVRELTARVKSVTRRAGSLVGGGQYRDVRLIVDFGAMLVTLDGGRVRLTRKEFELLAALAKSAGRVLTRERLIEDVWGFDYGGDPRTLDVHIRRLRHKLGCTGDCIETVIGVGYRFAGFGTEEDDNFKAKAVAKI